MLKVHILDRCEFCDGQAYVYACEFTDEQRVISPLHAMRVLKRIK